MDFSPAMKSRRVHSRPEGYAVPISHSPPEANSAIGFRSKADDAVVPTNGQERHHAFDGIASTAASSLDSRRAPSFSSHNHSSVEPTQFRRIPSPKALPTASGTAVSASLHSSKTCRFLPQVDGPSEFFRGRLPPLQQQRTQNSAIPASDAAATVSAPGSADHLAGNAIVQLLPFCTAEAPLTEQQVIALSDMAGNLKELMLFAMQAQGDERVASELVQAVGQEAAAGIVEFFTDEFEV